MICANLIRISKHSASWNRLRINVKPNVIYCFSVEMIGVSSILMEINQKSCFNSLCHQCTQQSTIMIIVQVSTKIYGYNRFSVICSDLYKISLKQVQLFRIFFLANAKDLPEMNAPGMPYIIQFVNDLFWMAWNICNGLEIIIHIEIDCRSNHDKCMKTNVNN